MIFERRVLQQLLTGVFWRVVVHLQRHERHGWTCPQPPGSVKVVDSVGAVSVFFTFESVWEGGCGQHGKSVCCPRVHPHTRGLILSASDGNWNMLFSTYSHTTLGKIRWSLLAHV